MLLREVNKQMPTESEFAALRDQVRQNLTNTTAPMIVKWNFNLESPADRTVVEVLLWNEQVSVRTPRRRFEELANMSDAERESWLFPFVVKLAEAA
jgi:hypothetical protein